MRPLSPASTTLLVWLMAVVGLAPGSAAAQGPADSTAASECDRGVRVHRLATPRADVARMAEVVGAAPLRHFLLRRPSSEVEIPVCGDAARPVAWAVEPSVAAGPGLLVEVLPFEALAVRNSAYPRPRNDGALWSGVGWSSSLGAGVRVRWRWVSAALAPRWIAVANDSFAHPAATGRWSPYGNPNHAAIDWFQRPGREGYSEFDMGNSYVRVDIDPVAIGASTENFWVGAAQVHPILVSATAPGFPHVFVGTHRPVDIWIGDVAVQAVWGVLDESEYFNPNARDDERLFTALVGSFSPRWLPGLAIGGGLIKHEEIPPEGRSFGSYLGAVLDAPFFTGADELGISSNGLTALLVRWSHPESGFEVYGEWSREDRPYEFLDLLREPDWTQAYALGFQKVVMRPQTWWRVWGELIHLGESAPVRAGKGFFSYYTHSQIPQGHTNRGQLLGAAIGPGSDAQILGLDAHYGWGMSGVYLERARYDEDTYYRTWARFYGEARHDLELTAGLRQVGSWRGLELHGELSYSHRWGRDFLRLEDRAAEELVEGNWGLLLRGSWRPAWAWRQGLRRSTPPSS